MLTEKAPQKSIFLLFSHKLTEEQVEELKGYRITRFVYLPEKLQNLWSNVPPEDIVLSEYLKPILEWLGKNAHKDDWVLVQGDFGAVFLVVDFCFYKGFMPVYAATKRNVVEKNENGKSIKVSEFKHERFRKYERYRI